MRKTLSLSTLTSALLIPALAGAMGIQVIIDGQTVVFVDVPQSAWFANFVHDAAQAGIVSGYKDKNGKLTGKFGPENSVTIAESLKIASEAAGYDAQAYGNVIDSGVNHWASIYVAVAKGEKFDILTTHFRLDEPATRAEVASIFASAFRVTLPASPSGSTFSDVQWSTAFAASIEALARDGILTGDRDRCGTTDTRCMGQPTYRPSESVNRAEVVKIAMSARAQYSKPGSGRTPVSANGSLLVTYRADTGFSPSVLRMKNGDSVIFKNDSAEGLWIAGNPHPTHTDYPGFDANQNVQLGQEYRFTFTKTGTWSYHNHLRPSMGGTIMVE